MLMHSLPTLKLALLWHQLFLLSLTNLAFTMLSIKSILCATLVGLPALVYATPLPFNEATQHDSPSTSYVQASSSTTSHDDMLSNSTTSHNDKRSKHPAGIKFCSGTGWSGNCGYLQNAFEHTPTTCQPLANAGGFGSIGPDQYLQIALYKDSDCPGDGRLNLFWPGTPDTRYVFGMHETFYYRAFALLNAASGPVVGVDS